MKIDNKTISEKSPVYFIADIAANHDGNLSRAKDLIWLAKDAGADAAKFQHFKANTIVSDYGFRDLGTQRSHQAKWNKSVFEVYKAAEVSENWTPILEEECKKAGISFFTSPYDLSIVDKIDKYVPAYKIGSGDITWHEILKYIAQKGKPYFLATGASTQNDVVEAANVMLKYNTQMCLMQCNTNYTGSSENFKYINLRVLTKYRELFPDIQLGLSDHTPGHSTVLGAVALGATAIEKHFTDSTDRDGPDHLFSMDPKSWREMIERTIELKWSLGNDIKKVEANELETAILQRRSLRAARNLEIGEIIGPDDISVLRPCPINALEPHQKKFLLEKRLKRQIVFGDIFTKYDLE